MTGNERSRTYREGMTMTAPLFGGLVSRLDGPYAVGYVEEWRKHPDKPAAMVPTVHTAGLANIVTALRDDRGLAAEVLGAELRDEWRFRLVDYPDGVTPEHDVWSGPMPEKDARRVAAQCVRITMKRPDGQPRKVAVEFEWRGAWWLDLPDGPARIHVSEWQSTDEA